MDNEKKFAETNYENKIDRDALLSMLQPRLELAKELLSDEGLFFCSIDDRNYAYVKLLLDVIFSPKNFILSIVWQKKTGGGNNRLFYEGHEYILAYAKDKRKINGLWVDKEIKKVYKPNNGIYKGIDVYDDEYAYCKYFGRSDIYDEKFLFYSEVKKIKPEKFEEIERGLKNGELYLKSHTKKKNEKYIVKRIPITEKEKTKLLYSIIQKIFTQQGSDMLISQGFIKKDDKGIIRPSFDYSKPVQLMKLILNLNRKKDSIILDFFAGSGTTGQAVLELNKEDNGNRKFILCVNNSGNSDEICKERLRRVMTGKTKEGKSNFPWIKNNQPLGSSLGIYNIREASKYTDANCLIDQIDERDYDLPKFKTEIEKIEWVCDNFKVCTRGLKKP